tara:strand:- start:118 stop:381 length:264 start_codon:yes stop_codon:yes gene_type:complete
MKKLIQFLMTLGNVYKAKTGNGVNIYNPNAFDLQTVEQLAKAVGFVVVYNPNSTQTDKGLIPPRLFVGNSQALDADDLLDYFEEQAK